MRGSLKCFLDKNGAVSKTNHIITRLGFILETCHQHTKIMLGDLL